MGSKARYLRSAASFDADAALSVAERRRRSLRVHLEYTRIAPESRCHSHPDVEHTRTQRGTCCRPGPNMRSGTCSPVRWSSPRTSIVVRRRRLEYRPACMESNLHPAHRLSRPPQTAHPRLELRMRSLLRSHHRFDMFRNSSLERSNQSTEGDSHRRHNQRLNYTGYLLIPRLHSSYKALRQRQVEN